MLVKSLPQALRNILDIGLKGTVATNNNIHGGEFGYSDVNKQNKPPYPGMAQVDHL